MTNVVNIVDPLRLPAPDDDGTLMRLVQELVEGVAPGLHLRRTLAPGGVVTLLVYITTANGPFLELALKDEPNGDTRNFFSIRVYNLHHGHLLRANPRLTADSATTQVPLVAAQAARQEGDMHFQPVPGKGFIPLKVVLQDKTRNDARIRSENWPYYVHFQCDADASQFNVVSRFFMNVVRAALNMDPL